MIFILNYQERLNDNSCIISITGLFNKFLWISIKCEYVLTAVTEACQFIRVSVHLNFYTNIYPRDGLSSRQIFTFWLDLIAVGISFVYLTHLGANLERINGCLHFLSVWNCGNDLCQVILMDRFSSEEVTGREELVINIDIILNGLTWLEGALAAIAVNVHFFILIIFLSQVGPGGGWRWLRVLLALWCTCHLQMLNFIKLY